MGPAGLDSKFRFPWREGNRFELLVDGPTFFPPMLAAIARAQRLVLLEMYLAETGQVFSRFRKALVDAAARGVSVHVLLDDFGSLGLGRADRQALVDGGVHLALYNPLRYGKWRSNLLRDHRKLLLVDSEVAFTGGAGLTDEFAPAAGVSPWHEVMVAAHGPVVADWHALFMETWNRWSPVPLPGLASSPLPAAGTARGRVVSSHRMREQEIKRSLLKQIRAARQCAWLATAYFVPSWKIRRALRQAAERGVDVRLLLPGPATDHPAVRHAGRRFYGRLLRHGVRIFEYQPSCLHAKFVLCDDWVSIGSSNLDRWNLRLNLEAGQEIEVASFASQVRTLFEADFAASFELSHAEWHRRPWRNRLQERVWGAVDIWLERLSRIKGYSGQPTRRGHPRPGRRRPPVGEKH